MSRFKKFFLYTLLGVLIIISGAVISIFLFKDRIIQQFVAEANKYINTPIKIGQIEIATWQDFPNLSIVFNNVYVEDSHPGEYPLLMADRISFSLNALEAWKGNYAIQGLTILNSETSLKINEKGENNFTILKPDSSSGKSTISFDLKDVKLINTAVAYTDAVAIQEHLFASESLVSSIAIRGDVYKIDAKGDVLCGQIGIRKKAFLKNRKFLVDAQVDYDDEKKTITIGKARLDVNQSRFSLLGNYGFKKKNLIDLHVKGEEANIQTILALLPDDVSDDLRKYQSKGDVFFDLNLKGEISKRKDPTLHVRFGCTDATFTHPDYQSKITEANLKGSFHTPSFSKFDKATLELNELTGELNGKSFASNLKIENLEHPVVDFTFKGEFDAASIQNFYSIPHVSKLQGNVVADFSVVGALDLLKKKSTAQQVKTAGAIDLTDISFEWGEEKVKINNLNGNLQFNNNDLAMSNLTGQMGNSDFALNGFFKNVITFLLFEKQPIGIEADLKSKFLDVDQLFEIGFGKAQSNDFKFSISPLIYLNFNCDVQQLRYKHFHPSSVKGDLLVKNQVAISRNIAMKTMGGKLDLNAIVDAKKANAIDITSAVKLDGIHIDSVFYVFENFYQKFIEDNHLKGQVFADVNMEMTLTENLKLISKTMIADISTTIKKGELNNFEPLQGLNKYLDDEGLSKLRFADLKNDIHIENETIYIPQMEIKSNVTTLQLSGTHTFDQQINYRVVAPLRNKKKIDPDEAFGAIEETRQGKTQVFLKITGTTDQYKISYDKEAVKKKIVSDLKKEVKELKEAFQLKGKKKKKEIELEKDDYFDWEN